MIQTNELTKIYEKTITAVDHLNLTLDEGESFGFLGPNGAGKTTTILLLMGLSNPTSGTATVGGHDIIRDSKGVRSIAGLLPEFGTFYADLTALQNLNYFGRLDGIPDDRRKKRTTELLETFGLGRWKDTKVGKFSRGMRQRLGLTAALMKDPKLIFLDEPTIGLDPQGTKEIRDMIVKLNKEQGLTVFVSSHLLHEVQQTCKRFGIIRNGKMVATDTIEGLSKGVMSEEGKTIEFRLTLVPSKLVEELGKIPDVTSVTQEEDRLYVNMVSDKAKEVSKTIVKHGVIILLMKPKEFTLEDIFLRYYQEA
jgi:ABC-2 type transport system ATP-binding protein